jgi:hypothetical protein
MCVCVCGLLKHLSSHSFRNIVCWVGTLHELGHQRGNNLIRTSNSRLTDVGDNSFAGITTDKIRVADVNLRSLTTCQCSQSKQGDASYTILVHTE